MQKQIIVKKDININYMQEIIMDQMFIGEKKLIGIQETLNFIMAQC